MKLFLIAAAVVVPLFAMVIRFGTRYGYETAPYRVVHRSGEFEIRDYDAVMTATTEMEKSPATKDKAFTYLFRYIGGANDSSQKIAMTTPVLIAERDGAREMSFFLPEAMRRSDVPAPSVASVKIRKFSGGRLAAYRFSGSWKESNRRTAIARLRQWMKRRGYEAIGGPITAAYDPPLTPGFLKRNEILIPIKSESSSPQ